MADWKDILNNEERTLGEDELLQYINGNTLPEQKQQIENLASDSFEADALEGIQKLQNPTNAKQHAAALKTQLRKHLRSKKRRKTKTPNGDAQFIVYAVIILLLICILVYTVVKVLSSKY